MIRAFAIYFQLVNIAEQNHRIRRKRDYERSTGEAVQPGSIESAIQELKERGIAVDEVQEIHRGYLIGACDDCSSDGSDAPCGA